MEFGLTYKCQRLDYDVDGNVIYKGLHYARDATIYDDNYVIIKFEYDVDGNVVLMRLTEGIWDDRATIFV